MTAIRHPWTYGGHAGRAAWPRSYDGMTPLPRCRRCDGEGVVSVWSGKALATCVECAGTGVENGGTKAGSVVTAVESGLSRLFDPDTSHAAGDAVDAANDCALVLAALRARPHMRGTTDDVLFELRYQHPDREWERNVVASRISQLKDATKWDGRPPVVDTKLREPGRRGRPVAVWGAVQ